MIRILLLVGSGSFIGGILRYLVSFYVQTNTYSSFPLGTFIVNIIGAFIIGIVYGLFDKGDIMSPEVRIFLAVGFCGGFTTFSSFTNESLLLIRDSQYFFLALYTGLSVFLGLLATYLGNLLIKIL